MHHADGGGLKDGPYHPNATGYDFCHQVLAKDQEWGVKRCLYTGMFYPEELKLVYYKDNTPFEGLVHWKDWEEEGDGIAIIRWEHIDGINKCDRHCRNRKPIARYNLNVSSED